MPRPDPRATILRDQWERAIERDRHAEAVKVLVELEALEPDEPLWSHRLGESYRRLQKAKEAEDAFARAAERYFTKGYVPRAIALAKLVIAMNPGRADLLDRIAPKAEAPAAPPPLVAPKAAGPVATTPAAHAPSPAPTPARATNETKATPPRPADARAPAAGSAPPAAARAIAAPIPLERAKDSRRDEVRFEDVAGPPSIRFNLQEIEDFSDISDIRAMMDDDAFAEAAAEVRAERARSSPVPPRTNTLPAGTRPADARPAPPPPPPPPNATAAVASATAALASANVAPASKATAASFDSSLVSIASLGELPSSGDLAPSYEPSVDTLATMAAFRLFAGLSRDAVIALANAADLVEFIPGAMVIVRDEPAFALYAIVFGTATVLVHRGPSVRLGEGDVFGEGCLLDEGQRQADVRAATTLTALRITKKALDAMTASHPEIEHALFDLLARRLILNLIGSAPLFTVFEPLQRLELAQMFEVRRAEAGTVITEAGRRTDALYILLAGQVTATKDSGTTRLARGSAFGHASLLGGATTDTTIEARTEAILLRLPAAKFASLAAIYPPALAYLSEIADEPLRASVIPE